MNTKINLLTVAIALSGVISTTAVHAASNSVQIVPFANKSSTELRQIVIRPSGPEADPYLQHFSGSRSSLAQIVIRPNGPEADL